VAKPKYLDEIFLQVPSMALDGIRQEILRFGKHVQRLTTDAPPAILDGSKGQLDELVRRERDMRLLYNAIGEYARKLSVDHMTTTESRNAAVLGRILNDLQHIGETISISFVAVGRERLEQGLVFSEQTKLRFEPLGDKVRAAIDAVLRSMAERDVELAEGVVAMKPEILQLVNEIIEHLGDRFRALEPKRAVTYRVENQAVELLHRMYYFAKKVAKEIITEARVEADEPTADAELEQAA
jgi:phosphate:Na+ symporter